MQNIALYIEGLRHGIARKILDRQQLVITLKEAQEVAARIEANDRQDTEDQPKKPEIAQPQGPKKLPLEKRINLGTTEPIELQWIADEERATLMRNGNCFLCRNHGHIARYCPSKNKRKPEDDPEDGPTRKMKKWTTGELIDTINAMTTEEYGDFQM